MATRVTRGALQLQKKSGSLPFDAQEKEIHAEFGSAGEFDMEFDDIWMLQMVSCLVSFSASANI